MLNNDIYFELKASRETNNTSPSFHVTWGGQKWYSTGSVQEPNIWANFQDRSLAF